MLDNSLDIYIDSVCDERKLIGKFLYCLMTNTIYEQIILFIITFISSINFLCAVINLPFIFNVYSPGLMLVQCVLFYYLLMKFAVLLITYIVFGYPSPQVFYFICVSVLAIINTPNYMSLILIGITALLTSLLDHLFWICMDTSNLNTINHYMIMNKLFMSFITTLMYIVLGYIIFSVNLYISIFFNDCY
jgi:hypothetical protein